MGRAIIFRPKVRPVTEDALFIHFNCYIPQICEFIMSMRKCFHFFQNDTFLAKICENRYFQRTIFAQVSLDTKMITSFKRDQLILGPNSLK